MITSQKNPSPTTAAHVPKPVTVMLQDRAIPMDSRRNKQTLTPREFQVLALIASGLIQSQIAETLGISVNTANTHLKKILKKLAVRNRAAATAWYVSMRFIPGEAGVVPDVRLLLPRVAVTNGYGHANFCPTCGGRMV